jgi:hypothetical protein
MTASRGTGVTFIGLTRACASIAVALAVATPVRARADVDAVLEKAATFEPTIHFGQVGAITVLPLFQTRWTYVEAPRAEPRAVDGFSVPRARLGIDSTLMHSLSFFIRFGTKSNGSAATERAYADARWNDVSLRAGQLPLRLNLGEEPEPEGLSSADFSSYSSTFAGGATQGAQVTYDGPVRLIGTVGNGARSGFSELLSPLVADVATTGRVEVPIGMRRSELMTSEVSFRRGQNVTVRLGAVGHIQTRRSTPSDPSLGAGLAGGDVVVRGSGFAVIGSFSYMKLVPGGAPTVEQVGAMVLASLMAARRVELWAQLDALWPIGDKAPFPKMFANGQPGTTKFRTMTVGADYFILPGVNRAKIQVDLQTMFDGQATSIVEPNTALGVLATPGAQIAARVQLVMAL